MNKLLIILLLVSTNAFAVHNKVRLKFTSGSLVYIGNAANPVTLTDNSTYTLQAGDTILLSGTYTAFSIFNLPGTSTDTTVLINADSVTIGGSGSNGTYCGQFTGAYFKIQGNGNPSYKYGINFQGASYASPTGQGIKFIGSTGVNATNYEISYCSFKYVQEGLFENPQTGGDMTDIYIHHNRWDSLSTNGTSTSECIYFGYSFPGSWFGVPRFYNLRIQYNTFVNVAGDAVQVKGAQANVSYNYIEGTGFSGVSGQGDGVQIGEYSYGTVSYNTFRNNHDHVIFVKGQSNIYVYNNDVHAVTITGGTQDAFYFNTVYDATQPKFQMNCYNNTFDSVTTGRALINNASTVANQDTSYYYQNCYTNTTWGAATYILKNTKDLVTDCIVSPAKRYNYSNGKLDIY